MPIESFTHAHAQYIYIGILMLFMSVCLVEIKSQHCVSETSPIYNETILYRVAGQYLDLENPISCNGSITALRYCLQLTDNSVLTQPINTSMSFVVHVWRPKTNSSYNKIKDYTVNINNEVPNLFTSVSCERASLNSSEYVQALPGDILGIYFDNPDLGVLFMTNNINESVPKAFIYYDNRPRDELRDRETLTLEDLTKASGVYFNIQAEISK